MAQPAAKPEPDGPELTGRIFIAVTPELLREVEDFRFANRFKSQSGAVRKLIELGLKSVSWQAKKPNA